MVSINIYKYLLWKYYFFALQSTQKQTNICCYAEELSLNVTDNISNKFIKVNYHPTGVCI